MTDPAGARRWARRALEAVFWWGACLGVWLISLSALSGPDLLVAATVSLPCGLLAVAAREAAGNAWSLRWLGRGQRPLHRLRVLAALPVALLADTVQALGSVPARHQGRFRRVPVTDGRGDAASDRARRAAATLAVSLTPGSLVVDIHPETGEALVHVLSEHGPDMAGLGTR